MQSAIADLSTLSGGRSCPGSMSPPSSGTGRGRPISFFSPLRSLSIPTFFHLYSNSSLFSCSSISTLYVRSLFYICFILTPRAHSLLALTGYYPSLSLLSLQSVFCLTLFCLYSLAQIVVYIYIGVQVVNLYRRPLYKHAFFYKSLF